MAFVSIHNYDSQSKNTQEKIINFPNCTVLVQFAPNEPKLFHGNYGIALDISNAAAYDCFVMQIYSIPNWQSTPRQNGTENHTLCSHTHHYRNCSILTSAAQRKSTVSAKLSPCILTAAAAKLEESSQYAPITCYGLDDKSSSRYNTRLCIRRLMFSLHERTTWNRPDWCIPRRSVVKSWLYRQGCTGSENRYHPSSSLLSFVLLLLLLSSSFSLCLRWHSCQWLKRGLKHD